METKKCRKCEKELPKTEEYFRVRYNTLAGGEKSFYFLGHCRGCEVVKCQEQRVKKRCEKEGWKVEEYEEKIKEVIKENNKRFSLLYKKHITKEQRREVNNRPVKNITDCYVRSVLKKKNVPKEIIETKRLIIKLNRLIKNGK